MEGWAEEVSTPNIVGKMENGKWKMEKGGVEALGFRLWALGVGF
jgi:hypothetical protein